MYSKDIEHVMMHLARMKNEVTEKIRDAPPHTRRYRDGSVFLAGLIEATAVMRKFWIDTGNLSIVKDAE